ncbi:autotransporter assembly complex protein TamB [Martelella alba]|uniref:Translocation/assembly module TamB n=1 Tax=Martelella alba TaxID=2590451 RepID=A0ABY2SSH2_9HYPH|nr:translocation/assembly module TamB domain-containing protein [Martelella alba]TKI08573.1 translocation/assembly module TamB [Martelella alba]
MSLARKIGLGAAALLLVLLCAVALLLGTARGLHLLLTGAARWVPGLEIGQVDGGWRDLTIRRLRYRMPGVTVGVARFHLALDPSCLRHSQLCLNDFSLDQVDVRVTTGELPPAAESRTPAQETGGLISTPYPLILRHLAINGVQVRIDDTQVALGSLQSGMAFRGNTLTLTPTRIRNLLVALPKTAAAATEQAVAAARDTHPPSDAPPPSLQQTLQAFFAKPLLPALPETVLPLNLRLTDLTGENWRLTGDTDLQLNSFALQAEANDGQVVLRRLRVDAPQGLLNASGQARLSGQWPLTLTLNTAVRMAPFAGEKIKLNLDGALRDQLAVAVNLSGPVKTRLNLRTRLAEPGLPLALTVESPGLQWPTTGQPEYQARDLALRLDGKATDYRLDIRASLSGEGLPSAEVTLQGKGDTGQFTLSLLRIAALQGHADLTALVDWRKAVSWRSQLVLSGIDTSRQWPEWPARLAGKLAMTGSLYGGNWQLRIPELALDGVVRQNAVSVRGSLAGNAAGQWEVDALRLALGRNNLTVNGKINDQLALDAVIDAPNLNGALPGLAGTIRGALKARGSRNAPQITADLAASGLRWQALTVRRVALNGNVRSSDKVGGDLRLEVDDLRRDAMTVSRLTLALTGDEQAHRLQLNIRGEPVSGHLTLQGGYDRAQQRWRGSLSQTRFATPVGEWLLTRPMTIDYQQQAQTVIIGPHCWQNPNARLCVPADIRLGASGQAAVRLERFDLAMLKPLLPPDTALSGTFSGDANLSWQPGGALPQGKIVLTGSGIKARQTLQGGVLPVDFDRFTVSAGLEHDRATLDWQIGIAGNGRFNGRVQVADPRNVRRLGGEVTIENLSLALLNPVLSREEHAAGQVNASLRLGGTGARPLLYGRLALERAWVRANWMPFAMSESQLVMNFNGSGSTLQGVVHTTSGQLNLSGDADWSRLDDWRARIAAQGSRVRITLPPMVRLDASPNITLEASPQMLTLNGNVDIPWARITVQELPPSAVAVSPDEVILDENLQPVSEPGTAMVINSNLKIHVGNDVRLDAFGLKARLGGDLNVVQDKEGLGLHGQINIPYGRFRAYGQDLIIRRGQLIFAGSPSQPLLNIEAIRNPDSTADGVTAGVRVTGMADQPKVEVFSDPVKSQQEALSYLLRGQGLDTPGADSSMMTSMLIGMGVAQSGRLVGKIGAAFGVSNLTLDTQGVGDESQVVVSGNVTRDLQVKYGVGIYDSLATLTLRYRLMPRLYLEAVSGLNQALDLLYQFEF